ncbi:PREDICTED: carboxypeptidase A1-like [Acropora digitifera]|uniref:carboxypeptidase A1-like n=1 Tax=Acropora digitifera TaxID=70779 RepID=UPI000779F780|nr:PREDICTED: carboxypeptidase A1-like [Acropora digitifera]
MKRLVKQYSNITTLVEEFGTSYEGRKIYAVKISSSPNTGRKVFFINCGIHAREWITPATCMNMIKEILTKYKTDSSVKAMVDKMDWVIMPVLNVDGYEYTFNRNRMWRKTRSPNRGSLCMGTDPNRNWNFKWAGNLDSMSKTKRAFDAAVTALSRLYGTSYNVGPSSIIIYENLGSTVDWAYGALGVKYAFSLQLRDKGRYGFMPPANQIAPTGRETFASIKAMAN